MQCTSHINSAHILERHCDGLISPKLQHMLGKRRDLSDNNGLHHHSRSPLPTFGCRVTPILFLLHDKTVHKFLDSDSWATVVRWASKIRYSDAPFNFRFCFLCHRLMDTCFLNIGPMILLSAKFFTYGRYKFSDFTVHWKWQKLDTDEGSHAISTAGKHRELAAMRLRNALCCWPSRQQPSVPCKPQCQRISFFDIQVKI